MTKETRLELLENGIRWCSNILVELLGNHGVHVKEDTNESFREATNSLRKLQDEIRREQHENRTSQKAQAN